MTLLQDIQIMASESTHSLPDLLRKTKILGRRLKAPELEKWADDELKGYGDGSELPSYRVLKTESAGWFSNGFRRKALRIPIDALPDQGHWREMATTVFLHEPAAYYQEILANSPGENENLGISWPMVAVGWLQHQPPFYSDGMVLESAWRRVSREDYVALLDVIRTRILDLALDVETEDPDAGETPEGGSPSIEPQKLTQIINQTIFAGGTQTVAIGSSGFIQSTHHGIAPGDLVALHNALSPLVSEDDLVALDQALDADSAISEKSRDIGPATRTWIANAVGKLGSGAAEWAGGQAAGGMYAALEEPIKAFLGLLSQ